LAKVLISGRCAVLMVISWCGGYRNHFCGME
jgi:hypothetical protein